MLCFIIYMLRAGCVVFYAHLFLQPQLNRLLQIPEYKLQVNYTFHC